jgi:hypothetical protein
MAEKVDVKVDSETAFKLPVMVKGKWIRFGEPVDYGKPNCNLVEGTKETGKSALVEALGTHYAVQHEDCKIIDFFGSRDAEGLCWCRSPYKDSILFVVGDSVKVRSEWDSVKVSEFSLKTLKNYKCMVTVSRFYSTPLEQHHAIERFMEVFWQRDHWDHVWCVLMRELANLVYSRISIGDDQAKAKAYMITVLREMRHSGFAVCADSIRFKSVDVDMRSLADFTFIKACGKEGLPDELDFLYAYFKPLSITRMPIDQFIVVSKKASIGRGVFDCPPWHKREREDLFTELDIDVEHTGSLDLDTKRGRIHDSEHIIIVSKKHEGLNGKSISYPKLAARTGRSASSVYNVVVAHNSEIDANGFCEVCKRLNGPLLSTKI